VARAIGSELVLQEIAWAEHLKKLADGQMDIAAGATFSPERAAYAYFSQPYRTETDVLVVPKGMAARYRFDSVPGMLALFAGHHFRVGVVAGFVYADERVNRFIADPANRQWVVPAPDDARNLQNLLDGYIDGFLADRIAAATTAWRMHRGDLIEEHPFRFSTAIHFMLSRKSQSAETLAHLNAAIDELRRNGEFQRIARSYALPVLIHQTLDSGWFGVLSFLGTIAFALSGVLLAYAGQYTLFGALVLASLPAVGGGVVRDLLLQREPLGVVRDPFALLTVLGTVVGGMIVIRTVQHFERGRMPSRVQFLRAHGHLGKRCIQLFDAVGLAAFLVVGVVVALDAAAQPLWLWGPISAAITSSFGGMMRDVLRDDRVVVNLRGQFYPEVAVIWGLILSLFLQWEGGRLEPEEIRLGVIAIIAGAFLTRLVAIIRGTEGFAYA
jgi:polar amino acid transport system substrate-binding protein